MIEASLRQMDCFSIFPLRPKGTGRLSRKNFNI